MNLLRLRSAFCLVALLLAALVPGRAEEPLLKVTFAEHAIAFSAAEFAALPHTELAATEPHSKAAHRYAGVSVRALLARAGAPAGEKLRGAALQLAVLVRGTDGYAVVFPLADFDEAFGARAVLVADREDGAAIDAGHGPLRLVVPGDQKAARWVRSVAALEIVPVGAVVPKPAHP